MASNVSIPLTRSSRKRKIEQNANNQQVKKARIQLMKEIARKFNKNKFNSNKSTYYDFNVLYNEQKKILPWLKKESLRWHVRASAADKKKKETATKNDSLIVKPNHQMREINKIHFTHVSFYMHRVHILISPVSWMGWGRVCTHFECTPLRLRAPSPFNNTDSF